MRVAIPKSTLCFSSNLKQKPFSEQLQQNLQLYTLISYIFVVQKFAQIWFKVYTSLQQGTCVLYCGPILQMNGSLCAKSGGHWSYSAGSHSTQTFLYKSSMHGISVIKTRWSLTIEIVNVSVYCTFYQTRKNYKDDSRTELLI